MKFQNTWHTTVFVRFFNDTDVICAVGFDEGTIGPGVEAEYTVPRWGRCKIEFRVGNLQGDFLKDGQPGFVWTNDLTAWIKPDGSVVPVGMRES